MYYVKKGFYCLGWVINFYIIIRILIFICSNTIENIIASEVILNLISVALVVIIAPILTTLLTSKEEGFIINKIKTRK